MVVLDTLTIVRFMVFPIDVPSLDIPMASLNSQRSDAVEEGGICYKQNKKYK